MSSSVTWFAVLCIFFLCAQAHNSVRERSINSVQGVREDVIGFWSTKQDSGIDCKDYGPAGNTLKSCTATPLLLSEGPNVGNANRGYRLVETTNKCQQLFTDNVKLPTNGYSIAMWAKYTGNTAANTRLFTFQTAGGTQDSYAGLVFDSQTRLSAFVNGILVSLSNGVPQALAWYAILFLWSNSLGTISHSQHLLLVTLTHSTCI
jgi:hypothetical protein